MRFGVRLNEFSVQRNHIHLVTETEDERALARAMKGLEVRIARALNRLWNRSGAVFADRYHVHALKTPLEVRNALVYVLTNGRKHGAWSGRFDPFSSAPWFQGWTIAAPVRDGAPVAAPRTWLLRIGWTKHGRIDPDAMPMS